MSVSVTKKIHKKRLRDALKRRQAARAVTHLYDHSVPTGMRFHGIAFANRAPGKPSVRVDHGHARSPYVIHLDAHLRAPEAFRDDASPLPAANLLLPERFLLTIADAERLNPPEDLALSPLDTVGQIQEDLVLVFGEGDGAGFAGPQVRRSEETRFCDPANLEPCDPPPAPALPINADYFVLPDAEDEPEPDLVLTFENSTIVANAEEKLEETRNKTSFDSFVPSVPFVPNASRLPLGWQRAVASFTLAAFALVLPIHAMSFLSGLNQARASVEDASANAISQLKAGASAAMGRDAGAASESFGGAEDAFSRARSSVSELGSVASLLLSVAPAAGGTYRSGTKLLEAGAALSRAGERIADGAVAAGEDANPTPVSRLRVLAAYASSALPEMRRAADLVADVDPNDIPEAHRTTFKKLVEQLPPVISATEEFVTFSELAQTLLGADGPKRYLLVFQNNTEIRATGGFMGSFAELDVRDGLITRLHVPGGGTYDLQGSLRHNVAAPEPLRLLNARWEFQDANWFPDFPTTARQIMDLYADAGGGTVDGVVAVNATYVADFLTLVGPVDMPAYGRTITSDNFVREAQSIVELEYDREENRPKAFIGDLAPVLVERIMSGDAEQFLAVAGRVETGLRSRDIQLYFADGELERTVRSYGWGGELRATDGDFLMLVNANLGGGKTDAVIRERANLTVNVDADGGVTNTLTVTRTHFGEPGDPFDGVNNVNYVRLYVPKGSRLLSATGFSAPDPSLYEPVPDEYGTDDDLLYAMDTLAEDPASGTAVYDENGKTVFGNWTQTKPGATTTYSFTYRLPFPLDEREPDGLIEAAARALGAPGSVEYSLVVQKQPGVIDRETNVTVRAPESYRALWSSYENDGTVIGNETDGFVGALFEKENE